MIIFIDNYDSFTYNIIHALCRLEIEVITFFNDAVSINEIISKKPKGIVIGPGPGDPSSAGISLNLLKQSANHKIPILGICLGMQAIGEAFGGHVIKAKKPIHGKASPIFHHNEGVFCGLKNGVFMARYHSLVVERSTLPSCLKITAETMDGEIMGLRHCDYLIEGVQFHPESIASEQSDEFFENYLNEISKKEPVCNT